MARYGVGAGTEMDWSEAPAAGWDWRLARRVFAYVWPYWRYGVAAVACLAVGAVLGLVPALVTRAVIDALAYPDRVFGRVLVLVLVGVGASLVGGLVGVVGSWCSATVSQRVMFDLREQLFGRLVGQSVGFFTRRRAGEVLSRVGDDVDAVGDVVVGAVLGLVDNLLVVSSTLVLMVVLSWRLTVLVLVVLPLALLPSGRVGWVTDQAREQAQAHRGRMVAYLREVLGVSGILLVKVFVAGRREQVRFRGLNDQLRRLRLRQEMIGRWFCLLMEVLQAVGPALWWLSGGWLVLHGQATVGTVVIFVVVLAGRLGGAVGWFGSLDVALAGSLALFHRIFAVLDLTPEVADVPGARPLACAGGAVAFERVTFAYAPGLRPALADVSFRVQPGQLVALVGSAGAGRSTVVSLVSRFYDPQQGRVLVDGHDVCELTLESLGGHVGVVFQDTFLFHASIADNLRYARPQASLEELVAAASAAHLHQFIASLPEGYDTVVGEGGQRLSGGERQRVAIARVVLKDPRILLLDEATSHLDAVSQQLIQAALKPLFAGRTTIAIAHRLSTVLAADQILVLDGGRLVERGTHLELLARGGLYAQLYERQFQAQQPASAQPVA